jgi:hypothetical protein
MNGEQVLGRSQHGSQLFTRIGGQPRVTRRAMLPINLGTRADVVIIPPEPGKRAAMARQDVSVAHAISYVVEQLSADERARAVVRTPSALLFRKEIEALYDCPEFPKRARN